MARKTDIRLRRSAVAGSVPSEGQLNLGELALNTADGALYFKKRDNSNNESIITAHDDGILHIDSTNARVGIGTQSPAQKLHVNGNIISSGTLTLLGDDPDFIQSMPSNSNSNLIEHIFAVDGTTKATVAWSKVTGHNEFYIESAADIKLKTNGSTTAVTVGTDQKVTLADELVLGNNQGIYLSGTDDGNTTTSSKLFRATGNATRLEYYNNSFIFDAKDNRAFEIRNQNDTPIFKVTVDGELADYDGLGGAADTDIENSIVAVNNGDLSIVNGALNVGGNERINNAGDIIARDLSQSRSDGQFEAWGDIRHRKDIEVLNSTSDGWVTWVDRNSGAPNLQNLNNITMAGVLSGPSTFYIDPSPADTVDDATVDTGTVVIVGDLRVSGTTTTINSTDINIADINLTLAQGSTQASDANGAGITVDVGTNDPVIADPTFTYTSANDSWNMNKDLRIATGDSAATFMVGRDLTDEYIKIEVQDLNNVITASQDSDVNQPNPGDVSDHKFILNRTFAGTGESDFVVQKDGTDQFVIDKDGNVGIGHSDPVQKLHVVGSIYSNAGNFFLDTNRYLTSVGVLNFGTNNDSSTPKMTILADGKVGIGADNPSQILTVENNSGIFRVNTSTSTYPRIELGSTSGTTAGIFNRTNAAQDIIFGEVADTGDYVFRGGNVGIGTSDPNYTLDIESTSPIIKLEDTDTNTQMLLNASSGVGGFNFDFDSTGVASAPYAAFHMSGTEAMRIDSSGKVGIGTDDPVRKLDVAGTIGFKGLQGSGGVGGTVADFTKHTWIENNTGDDGDTWHKVGTFTLPDNPYSGISLMVETVYPGSNHGGYDYNGHVWFNKVSVQRNGSTDGTVELDTGSVQGPESSKLRLHRNSVSEWELQIKSGIDNQALYADITQLSSAGGASFALQQSITAGSTGGTTITSPHVEGTTADNALTHTFGQLRTSGAIRSNGTIIANGVGTYDPDGDGLNLPDGANSTTVAAIAIPRGKKIVGTNDGYIRNIIGWMDNTHIDIGETNTALINRINLFPGHVGFVEIRNSRDAVVDNVNDHAKLKIKDGWNSTQGSQTAWTVGQIVAGIELDSSDSSGNSGSAAEPRSTINLVSETTDASATALTFGTKGNVTGAPTERLRITSAGNVGIGTSSPDALLHVNGGDLKIVSNDSVSGEDGIPSILFGEITGGAPHAQISYHGDDADEEDNYIGLGVFDPGQSDANTLAEQKLKNTLAITRDDMVGVGTIRPESLLNVVHQITANEYQYPLVVSGIDAGNTVDQTTSSGIGMQFKLANNNTGGQSMPGAAIVAVRENDNDDRNETSLVFQTSAHDANLAEHIRIKSDGKVGIGTNDPSSILHISSGPTGDAVLILEADTGNDASVENYNPYIEFRQDGGVQASAIGHTNNDSTDANFLQISNSMNTGSGIEFLTGSSDGWSNASGRMRIMPDGKVGIGTTAPSSQFQSITYGIDTNATPITATNQTATIIGQLNKTEKRSARFTVQATNTTDSTYMVTEILMIHDGTTPVITEYGTIFTGSQREATFDCDITGDNIYLKATATQASKTIEYTTVSHSILV